LLGAGQDGLAGALQLATQVHGLKLVSTEEGYLMEPKTGWLLAPILAFRRSAGGSAVQTATRLLMSHPMLFPEGICEYQHAVGDTETESIQQGFEQWVKLDWPVLRDAVLDEPVTCSRIEMEFPASGEHPQYRRIVFLGPVLHLGIEQAKEGASEEQHPSSCPCCLLTNTFEAFQSQLKAETRSFAIRLFAMRDDEGRIQADCRINGEDYEPGKAALTVYAAEWPDRGFESRKQYVVITAHREMAATDTQSLIIPG